MAYNIKTSSVWLFSVVIIKLLKAISKAYLNDFGDIYVEFERLTNIRG